MRSVDLAAELLLALLQRLLPIAALRLRRLDRLALARERGFVPLEGAQVIVHAREVILQLRVARAHLLPAPTR